jgi:hypothetical protein
MKLFPRMKLMVVILSTGILFLPGCKKSNAGNPGNPNVWNYGTVSANVAGSNWSAKSVYAVDSANMVVILGANDNSGTGYPFLIIAFPDNTAEGATVNFDISKYSSLQFFENSTNVYWAEPSMGGSGSVTITKFNKGSKKVEGTFTAVAKPSSQTTASKTISGGKFSINYR